MYVLKIQGFHSFASMCVIICNKTILLYVLPFYYTFICKYKYLHMTLRMALLHIKFMVCEIIKDQESVAEI